MISIFNIARGLTNFIISFTHSYLGNVFSFLAYHLAQVCQHPSLCSSGTSPRISSSVPGIGERFVWDHWFWCHMLSTKQVKVDKKLWQILILEKTLVEREIKGLKLLLLLWAHCLPQQRAKKEVSNSPGLVDFAVRLVNSVLNLPVGQMKYFEEFNLQKNCEINSAHQKISGASWSDVWASKC